MAIVNDDDGAGFEYKSEVISMIVKWRRRRTLLLYKSHALAGLLATCVLFNGLNKNNDDDDNDDDCYLSSVATS